MSHHRQHDQTEEEDKEDPRRILFADDHLHILSRPVPLDRRNRTCTRSSRSLSSADGSSANTEVEQQHSSFPMFRRIGTFPQVGSFSGPPRRPDRSTSLERKGRQETAQSASLDAYDIRGRSTSIPLELYGSSNNENDDSEEEFDRRKFLQLLFGASSSESNDVGDAGTSNNLEDNDYVVSTRASRIDSASFLSRCHRQSWGSAPPKLPGRLHSCSASIERAAAVPTGLASRQQSLPLNVFRPTRQVRNRRRSLVQDMLTPDSETTSRSVRLPPRLPSRNGSDLSNDKGVCSNAIPSVLVLGNPAVAVLNKSSASLSSSQKSNAEEAPKRPRRSLSPIFGESLRSLHELEEEKGAHEVRGMAVRGVAKGDTAKAKTSVRDPVTPPSTAVTTASYKLASHNFRSSPNERNTPVRSKTFSFSTKLDKKTTTAKANHLCLAMSLLGVSSSCSQGLQCHNDTCKSMLTHNLGQDVAGVSISGPLSTDDSRESLWTATSWPPPRRNRVAPGRSWTFTNNQTSIAVRC